MADRAAPIAIAALAGLGLWALLSGKAEAKQVPPPKKIPPETVPKVPPENGPPPNGNGGGDAQKQKLQACWDAAYGARSAGTIDAMREVQGALPEDCADVAYWLEGQISEVLTECGQILSEARAAVPQTGGQSLLQASEVLDQRGCHDMANEARADYANVRQQAVAWCGQQANAVMQRVASRDLSDPSQRAVAKADLLGIANAVQPTCPDIASDLQNAAAQL